MANLLGELVFLGGAALALIVVGFALLAPAYYILTKCWSSRAKKVADVFGLLSLPPFIFFGLASIDFLQSGQSALEISLRTFGLLPLFLAIAVWFSGIFVLRLILRGPAILLKLPSFLRWFLFPRADER